MSESKMTKISSNGVLGDPFGTKVENDQVKLRLSVFMYMCRVCLYT